MLEQAKYYFGLRNNQVVNINNITPIENGENCNCVCPGCGRPFVANTLGKKQQVGERIKYFSHKSEGECCDINKYHESVLHQLAKEVFKEIDFVSLPDASIKWADIKKYFSDTELSVLSRSKRNELEEKQETFTLFQSLDIDKTTVQLEHSICDNYNRRTPDVSLKNVSGEEFYVEICVKHPCEPSKIALYDTWNVFAIEIVLNINDYDLEDLNVKEKIKSDIVFDIKNKTWLSFKNKSVYIKNFLIKQNDFIRSCFASLDNNTHNYCFHIVGVEEVDYVSKTSQRHIHGYKFYFWEKKKAFLSGGPTNHAWISDECLRNSGGVLPKAGDVVDFRFKCGHIYENNLKPSQFIIINKNN